MPSGASATSPPGPRPSTAASLRQLVHRHRGHRRDRGMAEVGVRRHPPRASGASSASRPPPSSANGSRPGPLVADPQVADARLLALPGVRRRTWPMTYLGTARCRCGGAHGESGHLGSAESACSAGISVSEPQPVRHPVDVAVIGDDVVEVEDVEVVEAHFSQTRRRRRRLSRSVAAKALRRSGGSCRGVRLRS